jgi:glycosyltransferase involved in cell wall biosynthesis
MKIAYYLGLAGNRLYKGDYQSAGVIATYGQLGYAADFVNCANRTGFKLEVVSDSPKAIPPACFEIAPGDIGGSRRLYEVVLYDSLRDEDIDLFPPETRLVGIAHDARHRFGRAVVERCSHFICMSEFSVQQQAAYIPREKIVLVRQGIDLNRFPPAAREAGGRPRRVLIYGRLAEDRFPIAAQIVELVQQFFPDTWLLGDGPLFWRIAERFSRSAVIVRFVPSFSMPGFLRSFDLTVTSGRGVMESLACGIPCICAGFDYGGPVTEETLPRLWETNFTGKNLSASPAGFAADVAKACASGPARLRELAATHFDAFISVKAVAALLAHPQAVAPKNPRTDAVNRQSFRKRKKQTDNAPPAGTSGA